MTLTATMSPGARSATPTKKRDAEATRCRILAAATAEFAAHGIAGARVDRIAKAAQSHKVRSLARAQKEGRLPTTITAEALLEFVLAFCQTGLIKAPGTRAASAHRKRIAAGVTQLVES